MNTCILQQILHREIGLVLASLSEFFLPFKFVEMCLNTHTATVPSVGIVGFSYSHKITVELQYDVACALDLPIPLISLKINVGAISFCKGSEMGWIPGSCLKN